MVVFAIRLASVAMKEALQPARGDVIPAAYSLSGLIRREVTRHNRSDGGSFPLVRRR